MGIARNKGFGHILSIAALPWPNEEIGMNLPHDDQRACPEPVTAACAVLSHREAVMALWEFEVRTRVDGAGNLRGLALTQALPMLFDDIAMALASNTRIPNRCEAAEGDSPAAHGIDRAWSNAPSAQGVHDHPR